MNKTNISGWNGAERCFLTQTCFSHLVLPAWTGHGVFAGKWKFVFFSCSSFHRSACGPILPSGSCLQIPSRHQSYVSVRVQTHPCFPTVSYQHHLGAAWWKILWYCFSGISAALTGCCWRPLTDQGECSAPPPKKHPAPSLFITAHVLIKPPADINPFTGFGQFLTSIKPKTLEKCSSKQHLWVR